MGSNSRVRDIVATVSTVIASLAALTIAVVVVRREMFGGRTEDDVGPVGIVEPVANWDELVRGGHRIGPERATVTIVEFGDFQCPACGRFHSAVLGVLAKYPADVALVYRQLPLEDIHPVAYPAAKAAFCAAEQGRFGAMHDALFQSQADLGSRSLLSFVSEAAIRDSAAFSTCLVNAERISSIDSDIQLARTMNLRGTPTVIINGMLYASVPDSARLERVVAYLRGRGARGE